MLAFNLNCSKSFEILLRKLHFVFYCSKLNFTFESREGGVIRSYRGNKRHKKHNFAIEIKGTIKNTLSSLINCNISL